MGIKEVFKGILYGVVIAELFLEYIFHFFSPTKIMYRVYHSRPVRTISNNLYIQPISFNYKSRSKTTQYILK